MNHTIVSPYIALMRLDKPVGIWLLFWPCAWSVALHASTMADWWTLGLFFVGAVVMRSAGCIMNDIWDRDIDGQVERTRMRPLASGALGMKHALLLLSVLLAIGLVVLLQFNRATFEWAVLSLPLVIVYPLMKRVFFLPQLFLGLTFNWGALLGATAVAGEVTDTALLLYLACVLWTLGYDTIYACQDRADDVKLGIHSSALTFGGAVKDFIIWFYIVSFALFLFLWMTHYTGKLAPEAFWPFGVAVCGAGILALFSRRLKRMLDRFDYAVLFKGNTYYGFAIFMAFVIAGG